MVYLNSSKPGRVAGFILSILVLSGVALYSLVVFWPIPEAETPVVIKVEKGASLKEIGDDLKKRMLSLIQKPLLWQRGLWGTKPLFELVFFH